MSLKIKKSKLKGLFRIFSRSKIQSKEQDQRSLILRVTLNYNRVDSGLEAKNHIRAYGET